MVDKQILDIAKGYIIKVAKLYQLEDAFILDLRLMAVHTKIAI